MQIPATFETPRLSLRRLRESDAPDILAYCGDPEVTRYMTWRTHAGLDTIREFIRGCMGRWDTGEEYCWVVTVKPHSQIIGHIGCRVRGGAVDFGYLLHRGHWGHGFATEAARTVVDWAFEIPSVARVWATCDPENVRSARVLEKVGMEREALQRLTTIRPNIGPAPRDKFVYAKVR